MSDNDVTVVMNPTALRRVPREVTLPNGFVYRYVDGQIEYKGHLGWSPSETYSPDATLSSLTPTPLHTESLAKIAALMTNPETTEPVLPTTMTLTMSLAMVKELRESLEWSLSESLLFHLKEALSEALKGLDI